MAKRSPKRKKRQAGQAVLEYALLLFLTAGLAVAFYTAFNTFMNQGITRFNAVLENELASGGFAEAPNTWEN